MRTQARARGAPRANGMPVFPRGRPPAAARQTARADRRV